MTMKILNESLEMVPVADLKLHPRNARQGDIGAIHESIAHNGFYGALVVQRSTGHVLAGNHRLQAARHAGASEVPVLFVDVDDAKALRILMADNRTNDLAGYDNAALADLLREIAEEAGTLEGTGYNGDDLDELLADLGERPEGEETKLAPVRVQPLPGMTWVLIGIPTVRYGELAPWVEKVAGMEGTEVHLTANSDERGPQDG